MIFIDALVARCCGLPTANCIRQLCYRFVTAVCSLIVAGDALSQVISDSLGKLNVLFIAIDDLRPELGCYGVTHVRSPNIDRLATEGVRFSRAYCQFPVCGPSRASILSGLYPTKSRFRDNNALVQREAADARTLPGAFRKAGYHTVSNGKIFHSVDDAVGDSWSEPPFSLTNSVRGNSHSTFHDKDSASFIDGMKNRGPFFEAPDVSDDTYVDGQICEKSIKDLHRLAELKQPFFLACGFVRPHLPFYAPKKYWELYTSDEIPLASNRFRPKNAPRLLRGAEEIRSYHDRDIEYNSREYHRVARHGYYACVSYVDALVGRLVATLDELGIRDNTIVVLWGDHGWQLGEHNFWAKNTLLHNAVRSPLIISAPGCQQNVEVDGIVELIDIYPTLCELAAIRQPGHLEGASVVPLLRDPTLPGKQAAFVRDTQGAAVVTKDYLYTEYKDGEQMLFDHKSDPDENVNVAGEKKYIETVQSLSKLLHRHQAQAVDEPK